ncbi:hypothetical protein B0F90DRAFT_1668323 [Multifurca ochricompacta]|uniref:t-SNARE coiled-coil homology domain-containing protein n=1 Tax=Multifurca ochricompacta TaxID=376703 RepID=A0AAD4QKP2_9AGAM|nr:hypothetical protein B0F90DRAFT_1668323 [Multifurca ochricompacta]
MSSSRSQEETYEAQNDQRLDELHSKIRTLRGVTSDIYDDAERQNLVLEETTNTFSSVASGFTSSAERLARSISPGTARIIRIVIYVLSFLLGMWLSKLVFSRLFGW